MRPRVNKRKQSDFVKYSSVRPVHLGILQEQALAFIKHMRDDIILKRNWTGIPPDTLGTYRNTDGLLTHTQLSLDE